MNEIAYGGAVDVAPTTFDEFFHAEYQILLRAMYLITGNRHDAEELAQEALVKACERWDRIGRMDNPSGYVYRMALNAHRSALRKLRVAARRAVSAGPAAPSPRATTETRSAVRSRRTEATRTRSSSTNGPPGRVTCTASRGRRLAIGSRSGSRRPPTPSPPTARTSRR